MEITFLFIWEELMIFIIFYLQMVIFLIVLNFSRYLTINFAETIPHHYRKGDLNHLQLNNLLILVSYYFKLISVIYVLFIMLFDYFYLNLFWESPLFTLILIILKLLYLFPLILSLGLNFYLTFYHFSTLIHHYLLHLQPQ